MSKLIALLTVLRRGAAVADPTAWRRRQISASALVALLLALVEAARAFGADVPIDEATAGSLAAGLLALVNVVLTVAADDRLGLPAQRPPAADAAGPGPGPAPAHPAGQPAQPPASLAGLTQPTARAPGGQPGADQPLVDHPAGPGRAKPVELDQPQQPGPPGAEQPAHVTQPARPAEPARHTAPDIRNGPPGLA